MFQKYVSGKPNTDKKKNKEKNNTKKHGTFDKYIC